MSSIKEKEKLQPPKRKGSFLQRVLQRGDSKEKEKEKRGSRIGSVVENGTEVSAAVASYEPEEDISPEWVVDMVMKWMTDRTQKRLDLNSRGLSTIPPELCGIRNAHEILLAKNNIQQLPAHIKLLQNNEHLTLLDLSYNKLTSLNSEIELLTSLKKLKLTGNALTSIPVSLFKNITGLESLDVSRNNIASFPELDSFETTIRLKSLNISRNRHILDNTKGELPKSLFKLTRLKKLYLSKIKLNKIAKELAGLTKLRVLDLSSNKLDTLSVMLSDKEIEEIAKEKSQTNALFQTPIATAKICNKYFTETPLPTATPNSSYSWILKLKKLHELILNDNNLDVIPLEVALLRPRLKVLQIANNPFNKMPQKFKDAIEETNQSLLFLRKALRAEPSLRIHLFDEEECQWNIVLNMDQAKAAIQMEETYTSDENGTLLHISRANIEKLIQLLTHPSKQATAITRLFLRTYDYYINLDELLELIILRYYSITYSGKNLENQETSKSKTINLFKKLIEQNADQVRNDPNMMACIEKFANNVNLPHVTTLFENLKESGYPIRRGSIPEILEKTLSRRLSNTPPLPERKASMTGTPERKLSMTGNSSIAPERKLSITGIQPIAPERKLSAGSSPIPVLNSKDAEELKKRNSLKIQSSTILVPPEKRHSTWTPKSKFGVNKLDVLYLLPHDAATHLTMIEWDLFKDLPIHELLHQRFSGKDGGSPAITKFVAHFNNLSNWVATEIVKVKDLKKRVKTVAHFFDIAAECLNINNYSTAISIYAAMCSAPILRLKETWSLIPEKQLAINNQLSMLMNNSNNYQNYRKTIHKVKGACIPYLGLFLQDLTFIEEGNPTKIAKSELINFSKFQLIGMVIDRLQAYQTRCYDFPVSEELKAQLLLCDTYNSDKLYNESLLCEVRKGSRLSINLSKMEEKPKEKSTSNMIPALLSPRTQSMKNLRHAFEEASASDNKSNALKKALESRNRAESNESMLSPRGGLYCSASSQAAL